MPLIARSGFQTVGSMLVNRRPTVRLPWTAGSDFGRLTGAKFTAAILRLPDIHVDRRKAVGTPRSMTSSRGNYGRRLPELRFNLRIPPGSDPVSDRRFESISRYGCLA